MGPALPNRRNRRRSLIAAAAAAAIAGGGFAIATNVASAQAAGCEVDYNVVNDWGGGFQANVTITAGAAINGWALTWDFPSGTSVSSAWNVDWNQSGATFTGSDVGWNASIGAGQSREVFGFIGNGSAATPGQFAINGEVCDGQTDPTDDPTSDEPTDPGGDISWTLVTDSNPTADQQQAYDLITSAMDAAVARYNNLSNLSKTITVYYVPSVPTADGNINGTIRFGSFASMNERTALHEIGHTIGVGTSSGWRSNGCGGTWTGAEATALVQQYDGPSVVITCDSQHFWPYGLNYDSEFSQTNADRHVEIVEAMVRDGL